MNQWHYLNLLTIIVDFACSKGKRGCVQDVGHKPTTNMVCRPSPSPSIKKNRGKSNTKPKVFFNLSSISKDGCNSNDIYLSCLEPLIDKKSLEVTFDSKITLDTEQANDTVVLMNLQIEMYLKSFWQEPELCLKSF